MQLSKVIYRLSKLSRLLDIEGGEDDVAALKFAVELASEKLKEEQIELSLKHSVRTVKGESKGVIRPDRGHDRH